jgi:LPS-assembly protein
VIRRVLALFALCPALSIFGQPQSQPRLSADVAGGDLKVATLRGNAEFRDTGILLTAEAIDFEYETRKATAMGRVVFTRGDTRLLADKLVYQAIDGSFTAENVRLGQYPYYAEGKSAVGTRDEILLEQARIAYGEPGPWQPTMTAERVLYAPGQRIQTDNAAAGVGNARFLPFPRLKQDLAAPLAASLSLAGGYRRSLGLIAEAGVHVPVSAALRVGGDLGVYTSRGVMIGPSGRYSSPGDAERLRGYFRSGFINDHGDKGVDLIGRPVPEERAYVEWQHTQKLGDNLELKAQLNWWKDSEVLRDFRPRAFFPVQQPDTFVETVYAAPNYFLSAFARFQPNSFHRVQERLPEVRFDLVPFALGNGFYQRFQASAAVLREDPLPLPPGSLALSLPALGADRLDAYYAIERPFAPREWLAFTPIAGGRVTHYANIAGMPGARSYTRTLGEVGFEAALRSSGTFAYKNEQWKIDGLRHLFTPRLSYRYIPRGDRGVGRIPRIDREALFSTYLQPLGLGDVRNLDDLRATNTLRVSLDNILQTRDRTQGTRDLLALNIANDFRFKRRRGERDVSETHIELSATPARWLQFDVYQSFAPQTFTLREFNSALTIRDGQLWSLRFTNNFLRHEIEDYLVDGRFRINESYEAITRLHYDARRRRFNEQAYGIAHNIGNQWLISYTVSLYSGRRRESSFGFNVQIDTVRF